MKSDALSADKNKQRLAFIDVAKGIAILLVVAGHLLQKDSGALSHGEKIANLIYSFHIPAFFTLSGMGLYLSLGTGRISHELFKTKLKKYTKRLLLSYFLWSGISFFVFCAKATPDIYEWFWCVLTFRGRAPIWFLGALFWGEVAFLLIHFLSKHRIICTLITAILTGVVTVVCAGFSGAIDSLDSLPLQYLCIFAARFFPVLFFLCIGFLIMHVIQAIKLAELWYLPVGLVLAVVVVLVQLKVDNAVNVHLFSLGNPFVFLFTSLFGSLALVCICKGTSKLLPFWVLSSLGRNSLGIMLIHYDPFPTITISWAACSALPVMPKVCTFIIALAITTGISYFATRMINKKLLL
ncbi:MAG: acyltransferase family protein [Ruminococcus sp.]|nr:acyltransferase family protein [Ruminococcus sp.]